MDAAVEYVAFHKSTKKSVAQVLGNSEQKHSEHVVVVDDRCEVWLDAPSALLLVPAAADVGWSQVLEPVRHAKAQAAVALPVLW